MHAVRGASGYDKPSWVMDDGEYKRELDTRADIHSRRAHGDGCMHSKGASETTLANWKESLR